VGLFGATTSPVHLVAFSLQSAAATPRHTAVYVLLLFVLWLGASSWPGEYLAISRVQLRATAGE
jgi:hypothetical protein